MLEFKTIEELKPNPKLLEFIKDFTYKTKKGKVNNYFFTLHFIFYCNSTFSNKFFTYTFTML